MAGHIVGLGDRHLSNILIRETGPQRGSLVHIDLGIIFDQARHLPRPEQVPFRLTRDMIDGMGRAGTNGVMARCSQESLRVMRENKHSLLAIIDVLLHDPQIDCGHDNSSCSRAARALPCSEGIGDVTKCRRISVACSLCVCRVVARRRRGSGA